MDSGSNIHIFTDKHAFYKMNSIQSGVQQVSGTSISSLGIRIVIIQLSDTIRVPIYPVYYIPTNHQNTFSPSAFKYKNNVSNIII